MKYYSLKKILKKQATYNVILGERSNGKTYSALSHCVKDYFDNGNEMAFIRRWKEDIRGRRATDVYSALTSDGLIEKLSKGEYTGIHYWSGKFFPCNYGDDGKPIFDNTKVLGHTFALSDTEHNKSVAYPKVQNIVFDEFLTKHLYLQDEFVLFMNTVSTIIRQRDDVQVFMLGNTVNKFCPYFTEMGLTNILKMEQGEIDIYKYGDSKLSVAVEYCNSLKRFKKNNHYFAFDNPKLNMITGGVWELDIYPHLPSKYKRKDVMFTFFIEFNDSTYQAEIVDINDDMFIYIHIKTTDIREPHKELIYSLDYNYQMNYNRNILKPQTKLQTKIKWFFDTSRVYYQDNSVGDSISNYLKICDKRGY